MPQNRSDKPRNAGSQPARQPRPAGNGQDDRTRVSAPANAASAKGRPGAPRPRKKVRTRTVVKEIAFNILKAIFVMVCLGAMVVAVLAVQVVQYVVAATADDDILLDLENITLNQTSYIYVLNPDNPNAKEEGDWIEYQELAGNEHRIWVTLDKIPQHLIDAVVATEDRKFYEHHGVDFTRTVAALVNEFIPLRENQFGASTIHQQLVKNLTGDDVVADEETGDKTAGYLRKMREIFSAWGLANRYSKDMVMEAYLNTIGLSEQIAGVQAGALEYFGKNVEDLTLAECATIAGITQKPTRYSPFQNPENCLVRRNDVLTFMLQTDKITQQEYDAAIAQPLGLNPKTENESGSTGEVFSYFTDVVFNEVVLDLIEQQNLSRSAAVQKLYTGGYRIYATADLNVQRELDRIYVNGYQEYNEETGAGFFLNPNMFPGYQNFFEIDEDIKNESEQVIGTQKVMPQSSTVVINYDGELVAIVGGIGAKEKSLSLNRAYSYLDENGNVKGTVRQVGSTMKPVAAYALSIDYGITGYSGTFMDAGVQNKDGSRGTVDPETGIETFDWPKNFNNRYRNSRMPVVSAIAESTNTVAVRAGREVTVEAMYDFLVNTLEVSSLDPVKDMALAPLVLGSMTYGMSAYELAGAYMMYGNGGMFNSLHSYTRVEDSKGNLVVQPVINNVQAISEETAYVMNRAMWQVLNGSGLPGGATGTARGMSPAGEMEAVAKTGTTSEDRDRWFVGLTPYYVTAVWWGYDQEHDLLGWSPNARTNVPPNVWKYLMERVQADLPVLEFPGRPETVTTITTCTESGNIAGEFCPGRMEGFATPQWNPGPCTEHTAETAEEDAAAAAAEGG